jgi:hypothetical protein
MKIATNKDICFDPNMASNKPPYGVTADAILDSCFVPELQKFIIHVADMGTRHVMKIDDDKCPIQNIFYHAEKLRNITGVSVEIPQVDIAFNLPTAKNELVQCSYEKCPAMKGKKDSPLDFMTPERWALHGVKTKDGKIDKDSKQVGTARLMQRKWKSPLLLSIPIPHQGCSDQSASDEDSTFKDTVDVQTQLPNIISQVYQDCDQIQIDAKSVYSVKMYSTIAHHNTQKRSQLPLTYAKMKDLPNNTFVNLQRLFQLLESVGEGAMKYVKENGICARLEVSVRPSCHHEVGDSLRCGGHLIDILAHVLLVIHELFQRQKHKLTILTMPYEPVYTKVLSHRSSTVTSEG